MIRILPFYGVPVLTRAANPQQVDFESKLLIVQCTGTAVVYYYCVCCSIKLLNVNAMRYYFTLPVTAVSVLQVVSWYIVAQQCLVPYLNHISS